jgi:hypothetical protein
MPIASTDRATVSTNTTSDWVALTHGSNVIAVTSQSWGGTTQAALEMSYNAEEDTAAAVDIDGSDVVFTENKYRAIEGPGFVRIIVTNIDDPIELKRVTRA